MSSEQNDAIISNDINDNSNEINKYFKMIYKPNENNEEYKPFYRKVKEFTFWNRVSMTLLISIFLTFFKGFDIPVFWPLLLVYFFLIFGLVMKRQIQHMIKYHYLPWDYAKTRYGK